MKPRYLLVALVAIATIAVDAVTVSMGIAIENTFWTQAIPNTVGVIVGLIAISRGRASRMAWVVLISFCSILLTQFIIVADWFLSEGNETAAAWWALIVGSTDRPGPLGAIAITPVVLLAAVFPSGRLEDGWRWFAGVLGLVVVGAVAVGLLAPVSVAGETLPHPVLGDDGVSVLSGSVEWFLLAATILLLVAVIGMIGRLRRSDPIARQQIKWFVYGVGIYVATLVVIFTVIDQRWSDDVSIIIDSIGFSALPLSLGLAVSRYRLFEVDRIISRTVGYGLVLGVLAAIFGILAVLPSIVLATDEVASWQIALGTLAAAALFNPLRVRLQRIVDRRFDRDHYDAERIVRQLATTMQAESDLRSIRLEVGRALDTMVRPTSVAVWIRPEEA